MITGEIKNKVDQIWDAFWNSGVTTSITILEQMTYMFFMKMLDDTQRHEEANAGLFENKLVNPTFPEGSWHNPETGKDIPYNNMRWHVFKNTGSANMFRMVHENVFVFIKNLGSGQESAYSRYMSTAIFLIPNERTLQKVVDGIDALDMTDRDTMGDVYEYMLGKMAESGTNGQFRTPRHIIRMMVELMKPAPSDRICDPAMGSAGFILEAAKYIKEHYPKELMNPQTMQHFRTDMFNGFDTDQNMLRIGAMNMMLHGVDAPNIARKDSLSADNTDANKYTLCLANPPFAGSLDNEIVSKSLLALTDTKKTELLFVSLFVRMLQVGGRCASIVPDGVISNTSKAHIALRRELVDHQRLEAVISMPSGVFQPYSGVSTAILVFTKTGNGGTDKVWFYDMKADGFSLNATRDSIDSNDIPDIIARWNNLAAEAGRTRKEQSFLVPVEEIREKDYDFTFNKYKEVERAAVVMENPQDVLERIARLENSILDNISRIRGIV